MKKALLLISAIVILVSIFVSCSANRNSETVSTTAVTDDNGLTRYYEVITDDSETTDLYEIVTESNGKVVTKKGGTYVTVKKESVSLNHITSSKTDLEKTEPLSNKESKTTTRMKPNDDNDVPFEPTSENKTTDVSHTDKTETTTDSNSTADTTIQSATDADGWITKWY